MAFYSAWVDFTEIPPVVWAEFRFFAVMGNLRN